MYRPYFYKSYYELKAIAEENRNSLRIYEDLDYELSLRSTPYALDLRRTVRQRIIELNQDEVLLIPGVDPDNIFLRPDFDQGETWLTKNSLREIEQLLNSYQMSVNPDDLSIYRYKCWLELSADRRYQVPSLGRAELLTSPRINNLINLGVMRFVQEGIAAPGIYLRFLFGEPGMVGVVRINTRGSIEGFYEYSESRLLQSIIEATAFAYYRDLVIPGRTIVSQQDTLPPDTQPKPTVPKPKRKRRIPRVQTIHTVEEWHSAQEGEDHLVVGHIRWVSPGFEAEQNKQHEAEEAGVKLPLGYTWVIEHSRGKHDYHKLHHNNGTLTQRTIFAPPMRASYELDALLT